MHVCTIINMLALASEISGRHIDEEHNSTMTEFNNLIDLIYEKASYLHKWANLTSVSDIAENNMDVDDEANSGDEIDGDDEIDSDDDINLRGKFIASVQNSISRAHNVDDDDIAQEDEMMNYHLGTNY